MEWMLMPLRRYAQFSGRSRRKEYWMYTLFIVILSIVASIIDGGLGLTGESGYGPITGILSLATLIPSIAVGIRRLHDTDRSGWWLLIALVPLIGAMSFVFSTLVALLVDSDLNVHRRRKRMENDMARLSGHYIVCGIGRVGSNVAKELAKTKRHFVVVESERPSLDAWLEHFPKTLYVHDDAADDAALLRAGLMGASGVFAVTGDDSHNLMIALSVKMLNPKARVVVRLHDVRNTKKARRAGADEIVSPDFTGGMRIASAMVRPHVVNFMDQMLRSDGGLRVEEVVMPPGMAPVELARLLPRSRESMLMAAYENEQWTFNPPDDFQVGAGVTLVLMADPGGRALAEEHIRKHS